MKESGIISIKDVKESFWEIWGNVNKEQKKRCNPKLPCGTPIVIDRNDEQLFIIEQEAEESFFDMKLLKKTLVTS